MIFFDTHSHIIPNLDDGPDTESETLELLKLYQAREIKKIICTPHIYHGLYENSKDSILKKFKVLKKIIHDNNIEIEVYPASEIMAYIGLEKDLFSDKILTVNDEKKYVFIEFPLTGYPAFVEDMIFKIQVAGLTPILSHPERYAAIVKNPLKIYVYLEREILIQLNSGSITGKFGKDVLKTAEFILKHKLFHFVGTDTHSISSRRPDLPEAYEICKEYLNEEELKIIFKDNPEALISKNPIKYLESIPYESQEKKFFGFFKKIFNSD